MSWLRTAVLMVVVGAGCAKEGQNTGETKDGQAGEATPPAVTPGDAAQPTGTLQTPPAPPAAAGMAAPGDAGPLAGRWDLAHSPAPGGTRLQLVVDSVSGARFRAGVMFLMMGDVGIDPAHYEPQWGEISSQDVARFPIRARQQPGPGGRIVGKLSGDTVFVTEYEWAGENQLAGTGKWFLVRER